MRDGKVRLRAAELTDADFHRSAYAGRLAAQDAALNLPPLPTTTIGSFPQTGDIRRERARYAEGQITEGEYVGAMQDEIKRVVELQEEIGLDVLVHGEPERNDMVQYFAENLDGFAVTQNGWVQSYGSRCTRPSLLWGDVSRPAPITVGWSTFTQSLTEKPVKGMLTGPVTILAWSFVRDDQPLGDTANQVALALRDEIEDLEKAGIKVIQVDEPALRELLPLKKKDQPDYLDWSVGSFRLATAGVEDKTQIHTHLCYSEFGVVIDAINGLDADVTSIEAARSKMDVVPDIKRSGFARGIGPGVYDIHSPRVPSVKEVTELLEIALASIPEKQVWVNPDCGLKTRGYTETVAVAEEHPRGDSRRAREGQRLTPQLREVRQYRPSRRAIRVDLPHLTCVVGLEAGLGCDDRAERDQDRAGDAVDDALDARRVEPAPQGVRAVDQGGKPDDRLGIVHEGEQEPHPERSDSDGEELRDGRDVEHADLGIEQVVEQSAHEGGTDRAARSLERRQLVHSLAEARDDEPHAQEHHVAGAGELEDRERDLGRGEERGCADGRGNAPDQRAACRFRPRMPTRASCSGSGRRAGSARCPGPGMIVMMPATTAKPSSAWARVMAPVWPYRAAIAAGSPRRRLDAAQDRGDLAEDGREVAQDGLEAAVAGEQPGVAVALAEDLDGGLVVEHGRDDVAVLGVLLRMNDDPVAVADRGVDHRFADDLEHEQFALADDLAGEREHLFDVLLRRDRDTGRDATDERAP